MHVAHVLNPVSWAHPVAVGDYYLEDHNAAELLWASRCMGDVVLAGVPFPPIFKEQLWIPGKRVLVVRVGGFGDLLWLNPIYRAMRERGVYVAHCCFPRYAPVLEGFVDEVVPYPLEEEAGAAFDEVVWLENIIEGKACTEHPAKRLAETLGAPPDLLHADYQLRPEEAHAARMLWPVTEKPRICVQIGSSGSAKDYPLMPQLLAEIAMLGMEIVLVGEPRATREHTPEGVYDCTQSKMTTRESIAMAATCDAIVAPDSVFVHVGGALDIPVVGLFGPFSGKAYMEGYVGAAMQGRRKCSPCSWHPRGSSFPASGPCAQSGHCNALANIPPKYILHMLKKVLKK